jgi:hypothetical protein
VNQVDHGARWQRPTIDAVQRTSGAIRSDQVRIRGGHEVDCGGQVVSSGGCPQGEAIQLEIQHRGAIAGAEVVPSGRYPDG